MTETAKERVVFCASRLVDRVRRNHGLEHATLHVLGERHPGKPMGGLSHVGGFWILGDFETEEVVEAAREALQRLRTGEARLAVHPQCGTNFAAAGVLAGLAAGLAMIGSGRRPREWFDRLPVAMLLATVTLIAAQPLGIKLQEQVTTSPDPGPLKLKSVQQVQQGKLISHWVSTGE